MAQRSKVLSKVASKTLPCGRPMETPHSPIDASQLIEIQKKLRTYLSQEKLKYTEQRWQIAELILKAGGHFDAQTIVDIVNKAHPEIGAATVYRNLKVLCDAGLLEKSHQSVDGRELYELPDDEHHDHIICLDCGEILEFQNQKIEALQEHIASSFSFELSGHRHVIHGRCDYLKNRKKTPQSSNS